VPSIWIGLSGPAGLPAPIAERMQELVTLPRNPPPLGPAFVAILRADMATAREVARRYNIST
jgi:hypothetical protein